MARNEFAAWCELPEDDVRGIRRSAYQTDEDKAAAAIELGVIGSRRGWGGPFGAIVVDGETGELVGMGANLVLKRKLSIAHAEIVAITNAQAALDTHDLRQAHHGKYELITSCEPCAMCFGALFWCGLSRLVCCARSEDALAIGFDEGDKPTEWAEALRKRGIEVVRDVLRPQAIAALQAYHRELGTLY